MATPHSCCPLAALSGLEQIAMEAHLNRISLICSVNRALWEEVGPSLRVVAAKDDEGIIRLRFFIDGEPSQEDLESASSAAAEVIADFPEHELDDKVVRLDAPERVQVTADWQIVFMRREPG
ncbi:hypothetical protein [Sphingosinicella sp. BN140058]|uniref:hypothetical protein n=1 Tax=Sphingosinicella sp. BN140058 TaxID=1892855 RepID=UPI0010102632|nr:hypothetical protein [Sphingosinicella sp. BN140058]QAY75824.1 hypothetical protein ETR14_04215 [Sphingosinicella sp. BN140058]